MDEKKRLIRNTGIIAIGNISTKIVSFLLLPLYTSLLLASEYGIVDYIFSVSAFCIPFVSLLMDESMFRFLIDCNTEKEKKKIISISLIIILIGMGVFLCITIPIFLFVKFQYAIFMILYVLTSVISTMISALLRGMGRTDRYAIFNFFISFSQILLNVLFIAVLSMGVLGMLLASIISQFVISIMYLVIMKLWEYIDFHGLKKGQFKEMITYSIPLIPNKVSWSIINLSDRIVIMNTIGSEFSGLYAVSYKFPTLMDMVYGFFYQAWKESSARVMEDEGRNDFYNLVYDYLKKFMYSIVLGMIAFMPLIFHLLINSSYHDAILYVPFLLIGTYFANISGFYGGIFTAYKDTKIMGITTMIAAFLNLIINILLIQKLGLYAAAFSTLIANFVVYLYRKFRVRRYITLEESIKKQIFSIIVTVIILMAFYSRNTIWEIIGCIIATLYVVIENRKLLNILLHQIRKKFKYS